MYEMKRLNTIVIIGSKILEMLYWLMEILMILLLIVSVAMPNRLVEWISAWNAQELNVQGMAIRMVNETGELIPPTVTIIAVTGVLTCALMAMVFRNIYLIFRTARGTTWFSKGETPFQPDTVRMVREIGILCIAIPVIELVMSVIGTLVIGTLHAEISVSMNGVVMGIIILCLSQFFAYGAQLQEDVDGLI